MRKKDLWIIGSALVLALVLTALQLFGGAITTGSWGLSFPTPGQTPTAPSSVDALKQYDAAFLGNTELLTVCSPINTFSTAGAPLPPFAS